MTDNVSRRSVLRAGAGVGAATVLGAATAGSPAQAAVAREDSKSLERLYADAIAEGGRYSYVVLGQHGRRVA